MSIRSEVAERFPSLLALLKQPEVGSLLTQAVKNNWSPGKFQSEFIASRWFRSRSEPERRWWVLKATDPTEAKRQRSVVKAGLKERSRQLGFKMSDDRAKYMAELAMQQGITDMNDPRILGVLSHFAKEAQRTGKMGAGAVSSATRDVKVLARSEYFRAMPERWARQWGRDIALGRKTIDDARQSMAVNAMKRFPHLADEIRRGASPGEVIAPLVETVARELERSPETIDVMGNATWRKLLGVRDPKSGKMRLPTESDAIRMARSQKAWWKTGGGRATDAGMTQAFYQMFGARK